MGVPCGLRAAALLLCCAWAAGAGGADRIAAVEGVLAELAGQVAELRTAVAAGGRARHGYCAVAPNVTSVYIPVTRYTRTDDLAEDVCTAGAAAARGPPRSGTGVPSMVTRRVVADPRCTWGAGMLREPLYAYAGDTLVFFRSGGQLQNVHLLKDEQAFRHCDFTEATLLAGREALSAAEQAGRNFSYTLGRAGVYFFASDTEGADGVDRKQQCWDPLVPHHGMPAGWGAGVKLQVVVLDPAAEVLSECPLYAASRFGHGDRDRDGVPRARLGEAQAQAPAPPAQTQEQLQKAIDKLKGVVGAIGRQLVSSEMRTQERLRSEGNSGLTVVRSFEQGTEAYNQESYVGSGPGNIHNHADFQYTIGMGETGAVLNGVQFTTRHNDYSLEEADPTQTPAQYTKAWPPPSRLLAMPGVLPSVKGTVAQQVAEMREYFRAFLKQDTSVRADYEDYFKPNLCYMEGTWAEASDGVSEPFASDRHHIAANSWRDLTDKVHFRAASGQKQLDENLPYLPTAFRDMVEAQAGETFEPKMAQWFYRIKCAPVKQKLPTSRLRVRNDLHVQLNAATPLTRAKLAKSTRALFELNPTASSKYRSSDPWPKGRTGPMEFIDELMQEVPGFDGPQAVLRDASLGPLTVNANGSGPLNTAFYSRQGAVTTPDAMGRQSQKRGFNDYMFAAQTTHPKVVPQEACISFADDLATYADSKDNARKSVCEALKTSASCTGQARWGPGSLSADASGAKCAWKNRPAGEVGEGPHPDKMCVYTKCWTQRWTYAMPLEVIYTTPLTHWNPHGIAYSADGAAPGGGDQKDPVVGSSRKRFFRTPLEFFAPDQEGAEVDPADTSGGATYVRNKAGQVVATRASGHWIIFPKVAGVGSVRQRYPIMPIHEHGSSTWKEVKALQELLVNSADPSVAAVIAEKRSAASSVELTLGGGGGHSHKVLLTPQDAAALRSGAVTALTVTTATASAHVHLVSVAYDAGNKKYTLEWCMQGSLSPTDTCPPTLGGGECGTSSKGSPCCTARCPDGHASVMSTGPAPAPTPVPAPVATPAPTSAPTTSAPETSAPATSTPPTSAPETSAPATSAPETSAPATSAPEISAPATSAPATSAPETSAPATSAPPTSAPETSAPATSAPETSAPATSAPPTSAPETSAPATSAPATSAPETSAPATSTPETSAPATPAPTPAPAPAPTQPTEEEEEETHEPGFDYHTEEPEPIQDTHEPEPAPGQP